MIKRKTTLQEGGKDLFRREGKGTGFRKNTLADTYRREKGEEKEKSSQSEYLQNLASCAKKEPRRKTIGN